MWMCWRHSSPNIRSLSSGVFPTQFRAAYITPLLKKPDLDPSDGKSYRPISNLTVLSNVLERLVARQLIRHLSEWKLLPELQSAYRAYHSTETLATFSKHWIAAIWQLLRCSTYLPRLTVSTTSCYFVDCSLHIVFAPLF